MNYELCDEDQVVVEFSFNVKQGKHKFKKILTLRNQAGEFFG